MTNFVRKLDAGRVDGETKNRPPAKANALVKYRSVRTARQRRIGVDNEHRKRPVGRQFLPLRIVECAHVGFYAAGTALPNAC